MRIQQHLHPIEQYVIDTVTKFRKKNKLSQHDIAEVLGTSASFIGNIESSFSNAKYNLSHLNAIANHFDISPQCFLPKKAFKT